MREEALHVTGDPVLQAKGSVCTGKVPEAGRTWERERERVAARGREVRRDSLRPGEPWRVLSISDRI